MLLVTYSLAPHSHPRAHNPYALAVSPKRRTGSLPPKAGLTQDTHFFGPGRLCRLEAESCLCVILSKRDVKDSQCVKCSLRLAQSRMHSVRVSEGPSCLIKPSTSAMKHFLGGSSHSPVIAPETIWSLMTAHFLYPSPSMMVNIVSLTGSREGVLNLSNAVSF